MKKIFVLSIIILCNLTHVGTFAQNANPKKNTETVQESDADVQLEIKNGEVYLDGKKVIESETEKDKDGKIIRKKIIINGKELNEDEMQSFNFDFDRFEKKPMLGVSTKSSLKNDGAEVESVVPNSPAQKIGLVAGDIITRVNKKNIHSPKDLVEEVGNFKPGDEIEITFERENKFISKNVVLSSKSDATTYRNSMPFNDLFFNQLEGTDNPFLVNPNLNNYLSNTTPKIGVSVEDRADGEGVSVNEVVENSAAQKAGIEKNDVIIVFNSKEIGSVDDLLEAISQAKNKEKVSVEIKRHGMKKQVNLIMPKNLKKRDL